MATLLNIGLAVCCGGLLWWNVRLSQRNADLSSRLGSEMRARIFAVLPEGVFLVDETGSLVEPNNDPKAIH